MATAEEKARQNIDRKLRQCGWQVQEYRKMNISAATGIAIRKFPLATGEADYLLYVDGKAIGVIEARPEGHALTGVRTQSAKYTDAMPVGLPYHRIPLPFAYESTGAETLFTNAHAPDARNKSVSTFHRPEELRRLAGLEGQS